MATLSTRTAKLAATTALCSLIGLSGIVGTSALAREAGVAAAVNTDATSIPPAKVERTLIVGNKLVFEETVKTSPNGQAQLLMMDQSAVTVGPNSQLVIDKFVYDPDKRTGEMALSLSRGLMRFVGGRISKSGGVKIRTPVATMGIRGGIALINVVNEKTVDVTLLYGNEITGTTESGQNFEVRRQDFFTRIEEGKAPTEPAKTDPVIVQQKMNELEGHESESAGAEEVPTEEVAKVQLPDEEQPEAEEVQPVQQPPAEEAANPPEETDEPPTEEPDDIVTDIPDEEEEAEDPEPVFTNVFQTNQNFNAGSAKQGDNSFNLTTGTFTVSQVDENGDPLLTVVDDGNVSNTSIIDETATVVTVIRGENSEVVNGVPADAFNDGDNVIVFNATGTNRSLAGTFNGTQPPSLRFFENGVEVGDASSVQNIFDANDTKTYRPASTFNANAQASLGTNLGTTVQGHNFFDPDSIMVMDFTADGFDGTNPGNRFTIIDGIQTSIAPTGQSVFDLTDDTQNFGLLPHSQIGRVRLPIEGVQAGAARAVDAANITETGLIVDWDKGTALYVGGVFQNVSNPNQNAERAYGIQAVVGRVQGGGGQAVTLTGVNGGSSHFQLIGENVPNGATEVRQFHTGDTTARFFGSTASALALEGGHDTLEADDGNGVRQDPVSKTDLNIGFSGGQAVTPDGGTGVEVGSIFAAVNIVNAEGDLERLVSNPNAEGGVGTFTVDRDVGTVLVDARLEGEDNTVTVFQNAANESTFINNDTFAVVNRNSAQGGLTGSPAPSFVAVSGNAITAAGAPKCACEFMQWGYWAAGLNETGEPSNALSDIGAFFSGVQTPDVQMPVSGTATYTGAAYASVSVGGANPLLESGNLNYTTNFATGVGQGDVSLGANSFNMIGQHNVGNSALSVEYFNQNTTDLVGNGNGGFFGNGAQNMGVTININDAATGVSAAGVAVGERQAQP